MSQKLKFIDMFAGIGGFHSGMVQAGHKCVGWIEWDKFARQSYQAMYDTKGIYNAKDIQTVSGTDLPDADVWCFGSPCTNISVAGNREGIRGGESRMFFEVIRLLKERVENKKTLPSYTIMENVKNLLSSNGGWDFARVQIEMDKAGYDTEWTVFNSAEVVPQNRERVYIIGHLRRRCTRKVFPIIRQGATTNQEQSIEVVGNVSKTGHHSDGVMGQSGISKTITAQNAYKHTPKVSLNVIGNYGSDPKKHISERTRTFGDVLAPTIQASDYKQPKTIAVNQVGNIIKTNSFGGNPQVGRVYSTDGKSPTLNTMQGGGREPKILVKPCLTPDRLTKRQHGRRFKNDGEPAFTLTAEDKHGVLLQDGQKIAIRKLTPLECWRLQGFTDDQFYKAKKAGLSNSQLYKQAGNAVTIPVVRAIAESLRKD